MMWVGFELAATEVERQLGLSWGAAQKLLLDACINEEVVSMQTPDGPDVLDTSLLEWLKARQQPAERPKPKRALIQQAVNEIWPGKNIPKALSNGQIETQIRDWLAEHCKRENLRKPEISRDTILRAAGRKA